MFENKINQLLNIVSRSFALCIPRLPKQVRNEIGNFYLLCRYADSIEDSGIFIEEKKKYFDRYLKCLETENFLQMEELNKEIVPKIRYKNDKQLAKDFKTVFKQFVAFDHKSKQIALKWLKEMTKGMLKYSKKEIENFLELDNYCYYVAGTVGFYVTQIADHKFGLNKYDLLIAKAKDFGLLLQKVNIIKDFSKDYEAGKTFWPKSLFKKHNIKVQDAFTDKNAEKRKQILEEMVKSTEPHIKSTLEYLKNLPIELRYACAIPFYMAVPTLVKCYGNEEIFDTSKNVKISRVQTYEIISNIEKKASSDKFLEEFLNKLNEKNPQGLNLQIN
ncbi:MAG: squalene/phytoene synthase family protein [Candidatus Diapherotrites archaeon]|nr:squalene/phytoene synthase family protein [Candidatus Diapherotrites archaeon]